MNLLWAKILKMPKCQDKNWWKMPKLKNSNATFWVIFKHCVVVLIGSKWVDFFFVLCLGTRKLRNMRMTIKITLLYKNLTSISSNSCLFQNVLNTLQAVKNKFPKLIICVKPSLPSFSPFLCFSMRNHLRNFRIHFFFNPLTKICQKS